MVRGNEAVEAAREAFGSVTSLVNNAGVEFAAPLPETPVEELDRVAAVSYKGPFLGIRVNALHPGIVQTPMLAEAMASSADLAPGHRT